MSEIGLDITNDTITLTGGSFIPCLRDGMKFFVFANTGKVKYMCRSAHTGLLGFTINAGCLMIMSKDGKYEGYVAETFKESIIERGKKPRVNKVVLTKIKWEFLTAFLRNHPRLVGWLRKDDQELPPEHYGWDGKITVAEFRTQVAKEVYLADRERHHQTPSERRNHDAFVTHDCDIYSSSVDYVNGTAQYIIKMSDELFESVSIRGTVAICKSKVFMRMKHRVVHLQEGGLVHSINQRAFVCTISIADYQNDDAVVQVVAPLALLKSQNLR